MAYPIRTLDQLATAAWQFFTSAIPGAVVRLWPNTFRITGKVLALIDFENELRRQWLAAQLFASTADQDWLYRHGWELGLVPEPAAAAAGSATVACTPGLAIPAGLQWERADGATFTTTFAVTPGVATASLPMAADLAGSAGNTDADDTLALVPTALAPAGLGTSATVDAQADGSGLSGGLDAEATEAFRARVLYRKRNPPMGGSNADYVEWVESAVAATTGVWVDQFVGDPGHVWIAFTVSDQTNGVPSAGEVAAAQAYVADPIRRPVTAKVTVVAPVATAVNVTISNLYPDTADTQAAVLAELQAAIAENAVPGLPSASATFFRDWLDGALDRAIGVGHATLVAPSGDQVFTAGQLPVLGTVTFV